MNYGIVNALSCWKHTVTLLLMELSDCLKSCKRLSCSVLTAHKGHKQCNCLQSTFRGAVCRIACQQLHSASAQQRLFHKQLENPPHPRKQDKKSSVSVSCVGLCCYLDDKVSDRLFYFLFLGEFSLEDHLWWNIRGYCNTNVLNTGTGCIFKHQ